MSKFITKIPQLVNKLVFAAFETTVTLTPCNSKTITREGYTHKHYFTAFRQPPARAR